MGMQTLEERLAYSRKIDCPMEVEILQNAQCLILPVVCYPRRGNIIRGAAQP